VASDWTSDDDNADHLPPIIHGDGEAMADWRDVMPVVPIHERGGL
jgi:hypothetical protein